MNENNKLEFARNFVAVCLRNKRKKNTKETFMKKEKCKNEEKFNK